MDFTRFSGHPVYQDFCDHLRLRIISGDWEADGSLPSENELCTTYGLSRGTVRKAMELLTRMGLIFKVPGKGSFVRTPELAYNAAREMASLTHIVQTAGRAIQAKVLCFEKSRDIPSEARKSLHLGRGAAWYLERQRFVDSEVWALEKSWFNQSAGELLQCVDLTQSVYEALHQEYKVPFLHTRVQFRVCFPSAEEAESLQVTLETPVFRVFRTMSQDAENVFEYSEDLYRADRFGLIAETHYPNQSSSFWIHVLSEYHQEKNETF
jgi:GntR family transcriptional regulator